VADKTGTVAVIGGGWAGCAAAAELARGGKRVVLFEAGRSLGGRARAVDVHGMELDNGQHIMLGAYRDTLRLMALVGVDAGQALLNLPLQMRYPPGSGMDFVAPRLPAPLHLGLALMRAKGLEWADKMALARFSTTARWMDWTLYTDCSVSELLARFDQTARLVQLMWRPLCLAALNTAPDQASAQVFLNVLRDSLGAKRQASDMLLPRRDLGRLFPVAAGSFVEGHGGTVHCGAKVESITQQDGRWLVQASGAAIGGQSHTLVDDVILATPATVASTLLQGVAGTEAARALMDAFSYEPITTCYLQYPAATTLALPFYALVDDPATQAWGQFVFDRGQLDPAQAGLLAVVVSASGDAAALGQTALAEAVAAQLAAVLQRPELRQPAWSQVITEKRATFACTPGLARPGNASGAAHLVLAGDYTASDYPATLEGAVRSGAAAAALVLAH
jgi:squalene-associated FAD-dependent desaturase